MAYPLVIAAVAANIWGLLASHRNSEPGGCLFGDGRSYCLMASGRLAAAPFSRRLLVPLLVRTLRIGPLADRFAFVDILGLVAALASILLLSQALGKRAGLGPPASWDAGVIAASIFTLAPYATRDVVYAPTLVDDPALGLGMLSLAVMLTNRRRTVVLTVPPLICAAVAARESWALPLIVATLIYTRPWRGSHPMQVLAGLAVLAALAGTGVGLAQSYSGAGVSPWRVAGQRLAYYAHFRGVFDLAYQYTLALGALPFIVIGIWLLNRRRRIPLSVSTASLGGAAVVHVVQGALGGTDIGRIAYPALPICAVLAVVGVAATPLPSIRRFGWLAVGASVVMFHPWMTLSGPETAYLMHLYYHGGIQSLQILALAVLTVAGYVTGLVLVRRAPV